jgi:hypothetical protein
MIGIWPGVVSVTSPAGTVTRELFHFGVEAIASVIHDLENTESSVRDAG